MSSDVINDLAALIDELTIATGSLDSRGRDLANKERGYRVALQKALLRGRAEGYPATILRDICLGLDDVADAKLQRDIAQSQYDATKERIKLKLQIRIIDGSCRET